MHSFKFVQLKYIYVKSNLTQSVKNNQTLRQSINIEYWYMLLFLL